MDSLCAYAFGVHFQYPDLRSSGKIALLEAADVTVDLVRALSTIELGPL